MNDAFQNEIYWANAWSRHIDTYVSAPPRCGYWLASQFSTRAQSILEIAGGSCRDSNYLATQGATAVGTDFDNDTLESLKHRYSNPCLDLKCEDGFAMSFSDNAFEVSFSNGFWVLFSDNSQIVELIREQARVTRKTLVSFVHNIENKKLVSRFKEKSQQDSLYNIRFFHQSTLIDLVKASGIEYGSISFKKFGGPCDILYAQSIKGVVNPLRNISKLAVPTLYQLQPWSVAERIACVIELK